jgi:hypothetical protein
VHWNVFTEPLPGSALIKSITVLSYFRGYVTVRWVLDWRIGFIDTLYIQLVSRSNTVLPLSPHFTAQCCKQFTVSSICFLEMNFNAGTITVSMNHTHQVSLFYSTCKVFTSRLSTLNSQLNLVDFFIICQLPALL